jgi:Ca2+-binding RTX toxin-like protein
LTGGLGSDTFDYNSNNDGHDIITDFSLSEGDKLDISDLVDYQVNNNLVQIYCINL